MENIFYIIKLYTFYVFLKYQLQSLCNFSDINDLIICLFTLFFLYM